MQDDSTMNTVVAILPRSHVDVKVKKFLHLTVTDLDDDGRQSPCINQKVTASSEMIIWDSTNEY